MEAVIRTEFVDPAGLNVNVVPVVVIGAINRRRPDNGNVSTVRAGINDGPGGNRRESAQAHQKSGSQQQCFARYVHKVTAIGAGFMKSFVPEDDHGGARNMRYTIHNTQPVKSQAGSPTLRAHFSVGLH